MTTPEAIIIGTAVGTTGAALVSVIVACGGIPTFLRVVCLGFWHDFLGVRKVPRPSKPRPKVRGRERYEPPPDGMRPPDARELTPPR